MNPTTNSAMAHTWRAVPTTVKGAGTARMDIVSDGGPFSPSYVAGDILPEHAALIVRAVNAHAELVRALENLTEKVRLAHVYGQITANIGSEYEAARAAIHTATDRNP